MLILLQPTVVQRQVPVLRPISPESRDRCFDPSLPKTLPRIPLKLFFCRVAIFSYYAYSLVLCLLLARVCIQYSS